MKRAFGGADDVDVAGGVAADAGVVFAADKADNGVGTAALEGGIDGGFIEHVGGGYGDVARGEKAVVGSAQHGGQVVAAVLFDKGAAGGAVGTEE